MLTRDAAQGLTDAVSAAGLVAYVGGALRRGVRSPLEVRLMFAFAGLGLFFLFRGAAELLRVPVLETMAEFVICPMPVVGLVLTEGMLRRHAPRWLKLAITLGATAMSVGVLVLSNWPPVSNWVLGGYITLSMLALTMLLLTRDRGSMSRQENTSIDGLMMAGAGLTLLALTDFFPAAPVGASGLGAALLGFCAATNPATADGFRRMSVDVLVTAAAALVFALALGFEIGAATAPDMIRLCAVTLTFTLALTTALRAARDSGRRDEALELRRALAASDTSDLNRYLEGLARQPLLNGLQIAEGALLGDYEPDALCEALTARPIWTRRAPHGADRREGSRGDDELADLMVRTDASHAALISRAPLRIALLTLPEIGSADQVETDLALFRKLAVVAAEARQ